MQWSDNGQNEAGGCTLVCPALRYWTLIPGMVAMNQQPILCEIWIYRSDGRLWQRVGVEFTTIFRRLPTPILSKGFAD